MDHNVTSPLSLSRPSSRAGPSNSTQALSPSTSRPPPPSLFMGPASRNASHVSITPSNSTSALPATASVKEGPRLTRKRSQLATISTSGLPKAPDNRGDLVSPQSVIGPRSNAFPSLLSGNSDGRRTGASTPQLSRRNSLTSPPSGHGNSTGATIQSGSISGPTRPSILNTIEFSSTQWRAMQTSLETAPTQPVALFTPAHLSHLSALRDAQLALAASWARRGEEDEIAPDDGSMTGDEAVVKMEDEAEAARKRREANDRYFERVRSGIEDVVGRLEGVAEALKGVEKESRGVWDPIRTVSKDGTQDEIKS